MKKLNLLFTKEGLQYQLVENQTILEEAAYFNDEQLIKINLVEKLRALLNLDFSEIAVISAINHFTLTDIDCTQHELGYDLIGYNAAIDKDHEELMLSVNNKFGVQFYYALPKRFYNEIKAKDCPSTFNFSGEKFLNTIDVKHEKEIHINLYHHQCEFLAIENKKLVLYNNLDVNSEVDFLYFVMFTLSKIGFGINETRFFVYGETTENETFISELQKFVKHLKIIFDNTKEKNFILR